MKRGIELSESDAKTAANTAEGEPGASKPKRQRVNETNFRELKVNRAQQFYKPFSGYFDFQDMLNSYSLILERKMNPDPITFEEAISRARREIEASDLRLFEPLPDKLIMDRASYQESEACWMRRCIDHGFFNMQWTRLVGFTGEYLVFRFLESFGLPGFTTANWTSSIRKYAFPELPKYSDKDSIADFTYEGEGEGMQMLADILGIKVDCPKKFLIEVKTSKSVENCLHFSQRQYQTWQKMYYEGDTDVVYVILKVDNGSVLPDARITQVIENPMQYFAENRWNLSGESLRASWK